MGMCFEDHADIAANAHGMGQESAIADIARWLDLRASHRVGQARPEDIAIADLLRSGDWRIEAEELAKCR